MANYAPSARTAPRRSRLGRARASEHVAGWAFVLPSVVLLVIFGLVPIGWSFLLSLQSNTLLAPPRWVGLSNYHALQHDPLFRDSIVHTVVYTALFVPISVGLALFVAVALNRRVRFVRLYRTAFFVPLVTSTIATAVIFGWMLDPTFGVVNYLLNQVGIGSQGFFQNPDQSLYSVVAMTVWGWLGFDVIIYLAALQGIPAELTEAAEIDGASSWRAFRRVTLPLLGPATLFLVIWSTINALQLFDEVYQTTHGGPLYSTNVIVYYVYDLAFQQFTAGYAAAVAYVLFLAILLLTILQLWIGRKTVYYSS
jgi:multiple sugar transport system permease protein